MKKFGKVLKTIIFLLLGVYILLFIVFFFDLDGKLIFYKVEPLLCKHYEKIKKKDPLAAVYGLDKPNYEYRK